MNATLKRLRLLVIFLVSVTHIQAQEPGRLIPTWRIRLIEEELKQYDMLKERYRFLQQDYQDLQVIVADQRFHLENQEKLLLERGDQLIQLQRDLNVALESSHVNAAKARKYKRQRNRFAVVLAVAITGQLIRDILER